MGSLVNYIYIVSGALFILSLKWMNSPVTARRGVFAGEIGMLMAIAGTLIGHHANWEWMLAAFFIGTAVGIPIAYIMPMTAVPQRTAMSHACGALAAALVGTAEYYQRQPHAATELVGFTMVALVVETLLGFLTFTGSLMAMGKLQEVLPSRPLIYKNQNAINFVLFAIAIGAGRARHRGAHRYLDLPHLRRPLAALRRAADPAHRRRRHAHRDRAVELLRRPLGLRHGLRARQQPAGHRRRARWLQRPDSLHHHVQGHEPLVHQRAVRRLRADPDRQGGRPSSGPTAAPAPKKPRRFWKPRRA